MMTHDLRVPSDLDPGVLCSFTAGPDQADLPPAEAMTRKIEDLPREVGVLLMSVGALGILLPAVAGTPAIVAGGLILWPRTFGKLERWVQRRYPGMYQQGMRQIGRYLDDLEQRFPEPTQREADPTAGKTTRAGGKT